jgi:hypothetical protein
LANMMRLSADEFDTMLTNYRPCIGSNVKRLQHYLNLVHSGQKEEDGVYSWTQDTKAGDPCRNTILASEMNQKTLAKAMRHEDKSRSRHASRTDRRERSPHSRKRGLVNLAMGGMRLEANTMRQQRNTKSPSRDRDRTPDDFDTGELWKVKNEKLYTTSDWTQERMREFLEDKSHSVGNTRKWEALPTLIKNQAIISYRNSTRRACTNTHEFNNHFSSHLAKWVEMYYTLDITIAECRRRESIFRNNDIGSLASTTCSYFNQGECKYDDSCQHVHAELKEI